MPDPKPDSGLFLNQKQLARLLNVSSQLISRATKQGMLHRGQDKTYDLSDSRNRDYVMASFYRQYIDQYPPEDDDEDSELRTELTRANIDYTRQREHKVALQNAEYTRDLIPFWMVREGLGAFATQLRNNVLTLGDRVARGDTELRNKIEAETARAIESTINRAAVEIDRITQLRVAELNDDSDEAEAAELPANTTK